MATPYGQDIDIRERHLDWQTMGNARALQTHQPLRRPAPAPWDGKCPPARAEWLTQAIDERKAEQRRQGETETGAGWSAVFDGTGITLTHRGVTTPSNPLWILAVDTDLIPGHSSITNPVLICLFNELMGDPKLINPEGRKQEERLRRAK